MSVVLSDRDAALASTLPSQASATPATGEVCTAIVACSAVCGSSLPYEVAALEKFSGITTTAA